MEDSSDSFKLLNPDVSRETIIRLSRYRELILSAKFNLIYNNDKKNIWIRHFHDSIRAAKYIKNNKSIEILDIGSGAGFPGIPISLYLKEKFIKFHLCESSLKKTNFIKNCIEDLSIGNIEVIHSRVEDTKDLKFDYIVSRAVNKINELFSISYHLIKKNTVFLLHKGIHIDIEIEIATKYWNFEYNLYENDLEKGSYIFEAKNIIKSNT